VVSRSVSSQQHGVSDSKNTNYQAIPLLRPDEIMKLSTDVSLIIRSGNAPIKAGQYIWYKEADMESKPAGKTSVPKQIARTIAFEHADKKTSANKPAQMKVIEEENVV
jgi:type IV secretion system protein VirD4